MNRAGIATVRGRGGHLVENVIGVALAFAGFLVDQCHDSGKGGGRNGSAAKTQKLPIDAARALSLIRLAHHVASAVETVACEQRDVRHIPLTVRRHTRGYLPGWLRVASSARRLQTSC